MKKTIGILGGMGPMATAELFRMIVDHTESASDQEHIRIYIDNNIQIPDRTAAILSGGASPVPEMAASAHKLEQMGADFLIMPCNTAHYFLDDVRAQCRIPFLNMIEETGRELAKNKIKKAGLLATSGTIRGGVYEKYLTKAGIELVCPEGERQEAVMHFIYDGVKAGNRRFDSTGFCETAQQLLDMGAQTLILGCTELPVGMKMYELSFPYVDALETLAKAAITEAGYMPREVSDR